MLTLAAPLEARATARLAGFPGFLRANGFMVGGGDAVTVLRAAQCVGVLDPQLLRWSLRALLCGRCDEWRRFDGLFDAWFLPPNRWQRPMQRDAAKAQRHGEWPELPAPAGNETDRDEDLRPRRAASRRDVLSSTDFRFLTERDSVLEIELLMRRFARRLQRIRLRREAHAHVGTRLDLPGTIRRSVASGGTPFHLAWKERRRVRPRLVLLIDVSRSMAPYSFFYLRLARALGAELPDIRSFIFHTRLTPVSQALHDPDPWRAQEQLHLLAQGWGGGTRIGDSLVQFEREEAGRAVHSRTALLILSDGYDTGDPRCLSDALAQLRRRARRIVWINPLCQRPGYAPICQGMQAALPHLDLLAPGADLASLQAVLPDIVAALA
ncbi:MULTISPECIES: vWA domain-containing protein [Ramlibacter]|uniref:VWA domain-containing protein n=1 Tax=Ramlibacter pinisoli TaxID=2682844 RepID=A0A6N8IXD7_9BURK|nr:MULTISPECIES: VWA domain-containing protein [Ramlibacter]MBA2961708.1 VWA domain-containing protein [Ramlibacter sp. CGMCC 1.13660]MVQ31651.1 VWA domain-containing protein [Ramlibacter pinisoli]